MVMSERSSILGLVIGVALAACSGGSLDTAPECNPLGDGPCLTPWPSSLYEVADADTATGMRLDFPPGALPANWDDVPTDPVLFNDRDGFTPASQIVAVFPGNVDPSNLAGLHDIAASVTDTSPTVLIDMDRGERVAHFAEVDANADPDYDDQALYIRPAERLRPSTRYAVAIRKSLQAYGGGPLTVPAGFRAILDGDTTDHERLEQVRGRYDAIFAALAAEGIEQDDLVVAWDFTTQSDQQIRADLLGARDAALVAMGDLAENMDYQIDSDEPVGDGTEIARLIEGKFQAPMLLDSEDTRTGKLNRDAAGAPEVDGTTWADFAALVPACALEQRPVPILQFGHGFFGGLPELEDTYMQRVAVDLCVVVVGTPWRGMSADDVAGAALSLNDANKLVPFGERIVQGMVNAITLEQLSRGALAAEVLQDGDGALVDPTRMYFYGISQGAILGATFMAYDPFIERGALNVGGGNWSILFERSTHWGYYGLILNGAYPGTVNKVLMQALLQRAFDPTENIHTADWILDDPLPGTPDKQLLLQIGVGDCQVSNVSSEHLVRTLGMPMLAPTVRSSYGVAEEQGPLSSALVVYDEKLAFQPPESNLLNQEDNETHDHIRHYASVVDQIATFFDTGEIVNTCDGPCDCSTGACGELL